MSLELVRCAWQAAQDKKAKRLIFLDLRNKSDICDFQVVCSGDTDKQTQAICEGILAACTAKLRIKPRIVEGRGNGHWILMDYGHFIVHILLNQLRDYYALESLYPDAIVDLETVS